MLTEGSDDQRRLLLALTLSLGLFLAVQYWFGPPANQNQKRKKGTAGNTSVEKQTSGGTGEKETAAADQKSDGSSEQNGATRSGAEKGGTTGEEGAEKREDGEREDSAKSGGQATGAEETRTVEEETVVLENDELKATFSNEGATLEELILKKYHRTAEKEEKVHLFDDRFRDDTISFSLRRNRSGDDKLGVDRSMWKVERKTNRDSGPAVRFRHQIPDGPVVEKIFSLPKKKSHMIKYEVRFSAPDSSVETNQLKLYSPGGIVLQSKQDQSYHLGLYGYETGGEWTYENDITPATFDGGEEVDVRDVSGPVWTGLTTKYFASIFIPRSNRSDLLGYRFEPLRTEDARTGTQGGNRSQREILHPDKSMISYFVTKSLELEEGEEKTFSFEVYNGPKEDEELAKYQEYGLPNLINYGWFGFISGFFISILGYLYGWIPNYGVCILLLTLVVKLCLHPITKRAQVSMHKMKDLQPKIQELQEKYEDDRQKLGEEQMKLFKEHGVNPLGGCLPMVCQIPVLIGLYYGIRVSFEVRQKPFMLWVNDLSQPDHFMEIGMGTIMGLDFQYLNLLIIFMMATWLIQSLTHPTPSGGDGQAAMQQKMFKFMPMIFGVICYNFPSGLVLYWMMSTLFSALEQLYIRKIVLPSS